MYEDYGEYKDFRYYLEHKNDFRKAYPDKCVVIKDQSVVAVFNTYAEASQKASELFDKYDYHIQLCYSREDHYKRKSN
jgi:hypothetical protein